MTSLDIIICCHNDGRFASGVLTRLREQSSGLRAFSVIFVDNGSTDDTASVVEQFRGDLNLTYVYEPRLGLNRARNAGYDRSRADYVAHIDADAYPHADWVTNILRVIERDTPDLCGGPYFPYYTSPKPRWFLDRFATKELGTHARILEEHEYLSGSNMIWRRAVVERLGGFAEHLGLHGRGHARGDEIELMDRARRRIEGFSILYEPSIIVYHLVRPELFSFRHVFSRSVVTGRMATELWSGNGRRGIMADAAHIAARVPYEVVGSLWRDRKRYPQMRSYFYERMIPVAVRCGVLYQSLADLRSTRTSPDDPDGA
jgi:glucosyl-dolichyl phosphate glucuronosyltransferase